MIEPVAQATGKVVEKLVNGFTGSPGLLLIVILNVCVIGMSGYALLQIIEVSSQSRNQIMSVLEACIAGGSDRNISKEGHSP